MQFLEKDLEDIIYETNNIFLQERGLPISGKKIRQKRIGNYGVSDLITFERPDTASDWASDIPSITIYELKQNKVNVSTFLQAIRYAKGVHRYLKTRQLGWYDINICLIGRELDIDSSFVYLTDLMLGCRLSIYTYSYGVSGIIFTKHNGYYLQNEGF